MLHTDGRAWVSHKNMRFWSQAGVYIQQLLLTSHLRSGPACRLKATSTLAKRFLTPALAEDYYNSEEVSLSQPDSSVTQSDDEVAPLSEISVSPPTILSEPDPDLCKSIFTALEHRNQRKLLSELFAEVMLQSSAPVPPLDFLDLVVQGMENLHHNGRSNIIYLLAKAVGTTRPDDSDSLLPMSRMPTGLVEYIVNFFTGTSANKVKCPHDYRVWFQSMYVLFGTKWLKLHCGPMLSTAPIMQQPQSCDQDLSALHPLRALCNIPGLSERTVRRDIAESDITIGPEIQVRALDEAKASHPDATWWVKGDGVDVIKGLFESVTGVWSGDVDLCDGKLEQQYHDMCDRLKFVKGLGLSSRSHPSILEEDLKSVLEDSKKDSEFVLKELQRVNSEYEEKVSSGSPKNNIMFSLCWDIDELSKLKENLQAIRVEIGALLTVLLSTDSSINVPLRVSSLREMLEKAVKGVTKFQRVQASHIFVIMISCELRDRKPYAIPIPCKALKESELRRIVNNVLKEMTARSMKVAGFVCNGEFNYLRSKGYTRPVSILQIRSQVRKKYSKMHKDAMIAMLSPRRWPDGTVKARVSCPFVSNTLLCEILSLEEKGIFFADIIYRLRCRTVPPGYSFHHWNSDTDEESEVDKLRSILAQLDYSYEIKEWDRKGVPFSSYIYVPEVHPETGRHFLEREDEAHVLKRIATSARNGGPKDLCLERYVEALSDQSSGLTYSVFIGQRKQSVLDAERFFSPSLADFMECKGYQFEANYTRVIWNWRRSCDERGLSELQRCRFNYELLNYVLDELLPWHKEMYDFSTLEVNRKISNIRGFTRETLVAITTNIESREWRRCQLDRRPEHPRSGTSDDVECFFSVMRDIIGRDFTVKQVKYGFRKVCNEFIKRLDSELPFYYHTSSHTRFQEGPLSDFSEQSARPTRKGRRVPRREQSSAFAPRRATMPVRGSVSTRVQFHNVPVELPPPPCGPVHLFDHTY